jgi:hypothetical protein
MKHQFNPFSVEYEPITSPIRDFRTECIATAQLVSSKNVNNMPIAVMMSGGIDSELTAESFRLAGIPFVGVICKLQTRLATDTVTFNEHDYQFAERWCAKNNIEVVYCYLDIFKQAELLTEYALSGNGFSPQYAAHMFIMKWCQQNGFYYVAGMGEIGIVLKDDKYYTMDEQREFALSNFCDIHKIEGEFLFWKQDSRMTAATLNLPTVRWLIKERDPYLLTHKHSYFSDIFQFEPRPKYTGFEHIQQWDSILRNFMKKQTGHLDNKYYTPIEHFKEL